MGLCYRILGLFDFEIGFAPCLTEDQSMHSFHLSTYLFKHIEIRTSPAFFAGSFVVVSLFHV